MIDLHDDPEAIRVVKRLVPVQVEFAQADGVCETLEGAVTYRVGDALLTGNAGEHWPVTRTAFEDVYEPMPPVRPGQDGLYRKRHRVVLAKRLHRQLSVDIGSGTLTGAAGDWLLQYAPGDYGIVRGDIFAVTYDRV